MHQYAYPSKPQVVLSTGIGGGLALPTPDQIPLAPRLIGDLSHHGLDCAGMPQLFVRNTASYPFAKPCHRLAWKSHGVNWDRPHYFAKRQSAFFRDHFKSFVPEDVLKPLLEQEFVSDKAPPSIPKWQRNALVALKGPQDEHLVFFPSDRVLQHAKAVQFGQMSQFTTTDNDVAWRTASARSNDLSSNAIDVSTSIHQFEVLGSCGFDKRYERLDQVAVVAKGAASCSVLTVDSLKTERERELVLKQTQQVDFPERLVDVAGSPHCRDEFAAVGLDGNLYQWIADQSDVITLQRTSESSNAHRQFINCEYSGHPCVLWSAANHVVEAVDTRTPATSSSSSGFLFELKTSMTEILALKRITSHPFQFAVATGLSVEIVDSRMPNQVVLTWACENQPPGSALHEPCGTLDCAVGDKANFLISSNFHKKTSTIFTFGAATNNEVLTLAPLRSLEEGSEYNLDAISHFVASDSPLEIPLLDRCDWSTLAGVSLLGCSNNQRTTSQDRRMFALYLLNSLGDLHVQPLVTRVDGDMSMPTGIGPSEAPSPSCPINLFPKPVENNGQLKPDLKSLPLAPDGFISQNDIATTRIHSLVSVDALHQHIFSHKRLRMHQELAHETNNAVDRRHQQHGTRLLDREIDALLLCCKPSRTLFQLHLIVRKHLEIQVTCKQLMQWLVGRSEFKLTHIYDSFRPQQLQVLTPSCFISSSCTTNASTATAEAPHNGTCCCALETATTPCASVYCGVPHSIVITCATGDDEDAEEQETQEEDEDDDDDDDTEEREHQDRDQEETDDIYKIFGQKRPREP